MRIAFILSAFPTLSETFIFGTTNISSLDPHYSWDTASIDVFDQALKKCDVKDSEIAKEIRYNLARSYEKDGKAEQAFNMYRKLAQLDFGFKDVRKRVDSLRDAVK